jgi:hypothetical protein
MLFLKHPDSYFMNHKVNAISPFYKDFTLLYGESLWEIDQDLAVPQLNWFTLYSRIGNFS